ncbi:MAG TPA: low molecular weight protein-tyrosine-phosphatase [Arthrobacter sp.]|nr:low molecular weight protein-tyrosine-phosphatase [Arthrobacter sp.]
MYRIIAVCTGNICRSPMAERMLARALQEAGLGSQVSVDSAGTTGWELGRPIDQRAGQRLEQSGLNALDHRARQFEASWYDERDLILALDVDHYDQLRNGAPDEAARDKVMLWRSFDPAVSHLGPSEQGIYDPWFGEASDFEASWQMIDAALKGIIEFVRRELDAR